MVRAAMVEAGTKAAVAATLVMVVVAASSEVATESFPSFTGCVHCMRRGAIFKLSYLFVLINLFSESNRGISYLVPTSKYVFSCLITQ